MPLASDDPKDSKQEMYRALLQWHADMGVDLAIDSTAHDRFSEYRAAQTHSGASQPAANPAPEAKPQTAIMPSSTAAARQVIAPQSSEALAHSAQESARLAKTLDELRQNLEAFEGCGLKATATQLVFGDGDPQSPVMFVGEAPGADEDRQGIPFVGRAGQLLNAMLASIGLLRTSVYIANVVPWRPPGNRTPSPLETATCLPFIQRQIELVAPKILVCLGASSAQTLLGTKDGITRLRGRMLAYHRGTETIPALAMFHPAFLLRQPAQKYLAWQDLRMLAKTITAIEEKSKT
jgi:uracil-DNA glycosylase family 4